MNIQYYKPNDVEEWIDARYRDHGIRSAADLDIDYIASIFGIELHIADMKSFTKWEDGQYRYMIISDKLSTTERREHFFHELCHPLRHVGRQQTMCEEFKLLQETQAAHFQLYAAMPVYMLEAYADVSPSYLVRVLAEEFGLSERFVNCRLRQIQGRVQVGRRDAEASERRKQASKIDMAHVLRVMEEFGRWKRSQQEVR